MKDKEKMYCFYCDDDVLYKTKEIINNYKIHNINFKVKEKVFYCQICHNELINDSLDKDLNNIYNEYLKLYDLSFNKFREIRESLNLSQELFAKSLGWSKKTIIRYENFQTLPQPEYLLVYKKLLNNKMEFLKILQERRILLSDKDYYAILNRINAQLDIKKINVFLYILKDNYLNKTQIMKNLFAIDFESHKKLNVPITTFQYAHADYGPVIDKKEAYLNLLVKEGYLDFIDNEVEVLYKPCKEYDINLFTKDEIEIVNRVKNALKGKTAKELTSWSHKFKGWLETKNGKIIEYKYSKYFDLNI